METPAGHEAQEPWHRSAAEGEGQHKASASPAGDKAAGDEARGGTPGEAELRQRNRDLYEAARAAEEAGDWAAAIEALRQLTLRPDEEIAVHFRLQSLSWRQKASEQLAQARALLTAGRWDGAIAAAESALQFWPGLAEAAEIRERAIRKRRRARLRAVLTTTTVLALVVGGVAAWVLLLERGPGAAEGQAAGGGLNATIIPRFVTPATPTTQVMVVAASPSSTPTAIATATGAPAGTATATLAATQAPSPTATAVPPTRTNTPRPVVQPTFTPTRRPPTLTPTAVPPTPTPTATAVPPTPTLEPTVTPVPPTATPVPPPPPPPPPTNTPVPLSTQPAPNTPVPSTPVPLPTPP